MRTILLDATYEPLGIISWKNAWKKVLDIKDPNGKSLFDPKANVLWSYPEKKIRSEHNCWDWPAIIILNKPSRRKRNHKMINPSKRSILVRDMYTCQYCGKKLSNTSGTRDHVFPESRGGKTTWDNMVAACKTCQHKKGNKTCDEVNMYPLRMPQEPNLIERFRNSIRIASAVERRTWITGLKKLGLDYILNEEIKEEVLS